MDGFWLDTDMTPFWTQHIYPNVINQIDIRGKSQQAHALWLMSQAADSFSDSDLVQQQIRGAQNWGLLPLYGLTATAKVGLLAGEHNARPVQPQFPTMLGQISKGNKRARILRELAMHTSAKFSGGANGLRMDYFSLLRQRLTQPLVQRQAAGVEEVIGLLDELNMSKDDYDTLTTEFGLTGYSKDTIRIDGRVKSALTRQYNKGHKEVQKVKSSADDEGVGSDEEGGSDDDGFVVDKKKAAAAKKRKGGAGKGAAKKKAKKKKR